MAVSVIHRRCKIISSMEWIELTRRWLRYNWNWGESIEHLNGLRLFFSPPLQFLIALILCVPPHCVQSHSASSVVRGSFSLWESFHADGGQAADVCLRFSQVNLRTLFPVRACQPVVVNISRESGLIYFALAGRTLYDFLFTWNI